MAILSDWLSSPVAQSFPWELCASAGPGQRLMLIAATATSRVVHQSSGSVSVTDAGLQRSRCKTCGSLLAALDMHPRVAMQILRHSKIAVTMEIYTEVPTAATRDALKKLGQWLGS